MTKPISSAAQAVRHAAHKAWVTKGDPQSIAVAVLRAVADYVVPDTDLHIFVANELNSKDIGAAKWAARHEIRADHLAIAAELEVKTKTTETP